MIKLLENTFLPAFTAKWRYNFLSISKVEELHLRDDLRENHEYNGTKEKHLIRIFVWSYL